MDFTSWAGPNGIESFIINQTGCKPFSGAGINPRPLQDTTILKSVDDTYYYDDNLNDPDNIEYTLFGHNGDQTIDEAKFNKPFLSTSHIYLYRVTPTKYIWYGKYKIIDTYTKLHIGKDRLPRNIILVKMKRVI